MITTRFVSIASIVAAISFTGCAPRPSTAPTPEPGAAPAPAAPAPAAMVPAPLPAPNPALPPVPHVAGPLAIQVIYPKANATIASRDSNFVFGNVGNGDAALTINGVPTPVWPNGAFMGWLANPPADNPVYEIVARTETDSARITHPIKLTPPPPTPAAPVTPVAPDTTTTHVAVPRWASLIGPAAYASDTERVVTGYALTGGSDRWFLLPETIVKVVGTKGTDSYLQLDSTQTIRVETKDLRMLDSAAADTTLSAGAAPTPAPAPVITPPPPPVASAFTIANAKEFTDIVIPVTARPAFYVAESPTGMSLTLYGTKGPKKKQLPVTVTASSYVSTVTPTDNGVQMQYAINLKGPIYGYQPLWESGKFTFRVRKPPAVNPADPLRGLTITIDPGHPPIGATGPTGLWEPEVTLPVGLKVRDLLVAKGVNVNMTRVTPDPVDLNLRETIARRANANAFVSIHLNAVPDGQNPFRAQGTATYHFYPHSAPLAAAVQSNAVPLLGLPDNGVKRENFAVIRGTWMPSVLIEGAFIIMPDQEAALRTPEYQEKYAQGIVNGLEAYFRSLASPEK